MLLRHLLEEGLSKAAIAEKLGVGRRTIHYWIQTGQLDRDLDAQPPRHYSARGPSLLDPYKAVIIERLKTYPKLSSVRLFEEIRASGYGGGVTLVRDYAASVRPRPEAEALVRFETEPGVQGQVDFAEFHLPWGKRYALLVVLGYSRLLWVGFYRQQTLGVVVSGLEEAFRYFGGVPRELLFDQMKAVISSDARASGGRVHENPEFLRFAKHWGFRIRACRPYRAKTKGKVERPIRYIRDNFVYGREFAGDADLEDQCRTWLEDKANARVHGTTGEVPRERFERDERSRLLPLAERSCQMLVLDARRERSSQRHLQLGPVVAVERRQLAAYNSLAELSESEVA